MSFAIKYKRGETLGWAALMVLAGAAGCSSTRDTAAPAAGPVADQTAKTGLALTVDFLGDTDVSEFEFTISQAQGACAVGETPTAGQPTGGVTPPTGGEQPTGGATPPAGGEQPTGGATPPAGGEQPATGRSEAEQNKAQQGKAQQGQAQQGQAEQGQAEQGQAQQGKAQQGQAQQGQAQQGQAQQGQAQQGQAQQGQAQQGQAQQGQAQQGQPQQGQAQQGQAQQGEAQQGQAQQGEAQQGETQQGQAQQGQAQQGQAQQGQAQGQPSQGRASEVPQGGQAASRSAQARFETIVVRKSLEDLVLPGNMASMRERTGAGRHLLADHFTAVPAGCYDVRVRPMKGSEASADCSEGMARAVAVEPGKVKEVWVVSQCKGELRGALDTAVTMNHPPKIVQVEYRPSKFVQQCEATEVCVRVEDSDGDGLRLVVEQSSGPKLFEPIQQQMDMTRSTGKGFASGGEHCFKLVAQESGDYAFTIRAHDMAPNGDTMDAMLAQNGVEQTSHSYLEGLPLRVGFQPGHLCWNGTEAVQIEGTRSVERVAGCTAPSDQEFFCNAEYAASAGFDLQKTCPGGKFQPSESYPACAERGQKAEQPAPLAMTTK